MREPKLVQNGNLNPDDEAKFRRYLLGELLWELEQHPDITSPFSGAKREAVEVLTFRGYDDLRIRVNGAVYDAHLSWTKKTPPTLTRVEDAR